MSVNLASHTFDINEPIPGYHVQERIGAGGYGEVWRAEAPGAIAKAIKIVYGCHDADRARRELTSLNRIKEVRHPFLLSLERIELVDGHLVIVTELASSSLKNQFEHYRQSGQCGIPRRELLAHLGDAADALDYICQEHSLQHLDVKPENLLLVGGRIKVADFGLVKDLQDASCSIINGLTPVYAAPELFDGRPNNRSDQYSLAIVYQEMLTGVLPHEGRTTAQLAAQHLHSRPHLDRLPLCDQPIIARALSKNPDQRFPSCREMIDSLLGAALDGRPRPLPAPPPLHGSFVPCSPATNTEVLQQHAAAPAARSITEPREAAPAEYDLPPLEIRAEDVEYRPTIFVGMGGLAARTLHALHRRLADRFGDLGSVPALQMLLFDTDVETLKSVTEGESQTPLPNESAIPLPLRQSAEYRHESDDYLQWLSRRWIFNIPRSLQTQGFRPLGRLALVDHFQRVLDRLTRVVKAAVAREGMALSARTSGLAFRDATPRVFVVSSISGGTGSGMVLDVGYTVRKVLRDLGLSEEGLCGVLAHCAGRKPQARDLAAANAYALLCELAHYSDRQHVYPGAPLRGLPAFAAEDGPFVHTYVVHLGEDLEPHQFAAAADNLARYLYCNAVTPAAAFFDKARQPQPTDGPSAGAPPAVRTFGLCQLGFCDADIPVTAVDELCRSLVTRWRGAGRAENEERPPSLADPTSLLVTQRAAEMGQKQLCGALASRAEAAGLNVQQIAGRLSDVATQALGNDPRSYLLTLLAELVHNCEAERGPAGRLPSGAMIVSALNTVIRWEGAHDTGGVCLEAVLEQHLKELAAGQAAALQEWILTLIGDPQQRVEGAQRAADYTADFLRALSHEAGEAVQAARREIQIIETALHNDDRGSCQWLRFRGLPWRRRLAADDRLSDYFRLRIRELTLHGVCRLASLILAQVMTLDDRLRNLAADLNRLAEQFQHTPLPDKERCAAAGPENVAHIVTETIDRQRTELIEAVEHSLEDDLRRIVTAADGDVRSVLPGLLRRTARSAILRVLEQLALEKIAAGEAGPQASIYSLGSGLRAATPRLPQCGGGKRLLLLAPRGCASPPLLDQLRGKAGGPPTAVCNAENDLLLCYEAQDLSLRRVAQAVLDHRLECVEVASRLHTRIDVPWTTL